MQIKYEDIFVAMMLGAEQDAAKYVKSKDKVNH